MEVNEEYAVAYAEVWEVLQTLVEEDYRKIPQSYFEYIDKYRSRNCDFEYDHSKAFEEQPLSDTAKYILFGFFAKFGATPEQCDAIQKFRDLKLKEMKLQKYVEFIRTPRKLDFG